MDPRHHARDHGSRQGADQGPDDDPTADLEAVAAATPDGGCGHGKLVLAEACLLEFSEEALGKLKEAGFGQDQLSVSTPAVRRRGRYGLKVGSGIVIGTLVGALAGAVVTGMV